MKKGWALILLLAVACGTGGSKPAAIRVVATPQPTSHTEVAVDLPTPTKEPEPDPATVAPSAQLAAPLPPKPMPVAPVITLASVTAFRGLGSWIDVFDYNDDPKTILPLVDEMAAHGVKTLYLETSRYQSPTDIQFPKALGAGLDAAKSKGMRVVAWYPPAFDDVGRDVRRSLAAITFRSPNGNKFDAFAADIEYTQNVPDHEERNGRTIDYSKKLRAGAGLSYPLAAIVIPPSWLEIRPDRWPNFPWSALSSMYDLFQPMNYWTARGKDAKTAYDLTAKDAKETRRLTGKPVHIIGGLGADADESQVTAYVKAVRDSGSIGGGLYDYTTTSSKVWDELLKLNG